MKQSLYNIFFEIDGASSGKFLGYNALMNGLALMEDKTVRFVKNIEYENLNSLKIEKNVFEELKKGGFIIDDDFDEIELLKFKRDQIRYGNSVFSLTILPTLDCNLGCAYCFEERKPIYMSEEVVKALVKFADYSLDKYTPRSFSVSWYGGEPLLKLDLIERLTSEFKELCLGYQCEYSASIVSNGTLITEDDAYRIKMLGVEEVQVTIDGDEDTHNARRPYLDGRGSFEDVLRGIKNLYKYGVPVSLRVNIDRTNGNIDTHFFEEYGIIEILKQEENRLHFGFVRACNSSCGCSVNDCFTHKEFYDIEYRLRRELLEKYDVKTSFYPSPVYGCVATTPYGYVIGPEGELYKCWEDVGIKGEIVGDIFNGPVFDKNHLDHLTVEVDDEECLKCKFLPLCHGGCPKILVKRKRGEKLPRDCAPYKFNIKRTLGYYYRKIYDGNTCEETE